MNSISFASDVLVRDIDQLSYAEWLEVRRCLIGGSDAAAADEDAAAERRRLFENRLKDQLQNQERGLTSKGFVVSWKEVAATRFDTKKFKTDHPDLAAAYLSESSSRRFTISLPGGK